LERIIDFDSIFYELILRRGRWFLNDLLKANSFSFINSNIVEAKIKIV